MRRRAPDYPDCRLCLAERLGVAPVARAQDAPLCRPHPRHPALRAGGASAPRRPSLQLCRPSAGREARLDRSLDAEALRERLGIASDRAVLVVLPGSRSSEVKRLMAPFGDALRLLAASGWNLRGDLAGCRQRARARSRRGSLPGPCSRISSAARPTNSLPSSSPAPRLPPPAR